MPVSAAQRDLEKKLKLERTVTPEIKSLFARIVKDYKANILATGFPNDASEYEVDWEALLKKHYSRVQTSFEGVVIEDNPEAIETEEEEDNVNSLLALLLLAFRTNESKKQAAIITRTNNKQMTAALTNARIALSEAGETLTNRNISIQAGRNLSRIFRPRSGNIALTETQGAAENVKFSEAKTIKQVTKSRWEKTWVTIGDSAVRRHHQEANFQKVAGDVPFEVGGEKLMYPRDTSLGASAFNIARCRCSAIYSFVRLGAKHLTKILNQIKGWKNGN